MAFNPLNFFEIGTNIGRVNSPAFGPAQMIRNILEQAQRKGLIQAQSEAQLGQAKELAEFKHGLKDEPKTQKVFSLTKEGALSERGEVPKGSRVISPGLLGSLLFDDETDNPNPTAAGVTSPSPEDVLQQLLIKIEERRAAQNATNAR